MSSPRLHVLPWDQPFVRAAVGWLAGDWAGGAPLDLSDVLVIAPTRQSGRRLREALAEHAAARGQAVFAPRVVMPQGFIREAMPMGGVATATESLLAWAEVLGEIELAAFAEVFPVEPPTRAFTWASRLAREFQQLQATLAENGLRIGGVVARAGDDFPEVGRWTQLAELEARYDAALARRGLRDAQAAKIGFVQRPALPAGIRCIALLGTPDPLPLAVARLAAHAGEIPIAVVVAGPVEEDAAALFDEWGRPQAEFWGRRALVLDDFYGQVHLCADPAAQARQLVTCAQAYGEPEGLLAIGVGDAEILASLQNGLSRAGLAAYNPEGEARQRDALFSLLQLLAAWAAEDTFETVAALVRCPDVLTWLRGRLQGGFSSTKVLGGLDALQQRHLPPTLEAARRHAAGGDRAPVLTKAELAARTYTRPSEDPLLAGALAVLADLRAELTDGAFPGAVRTTLTTLFAGRPFDLSVEADGRLVESAGVWNEILTETAAAVARFGGVRPGDAWELALRTFGESMRFGEKPAGALELQGWLELLWEDAPHLVVAGLNDGHVPDAVVSDAFLPESLRARLGLKTNATRFARDAYLLQALASARSGRGRLDLLVGKTSLEGEPLRPSRLLLRCADAELPRRVAFLFRTVESAEASLPWRRAWRLEPRLEPALRRLSVTAFRAYLACPFRFYLRYGLQMETVDPHKAELDARDFGELCHAALEAMGRDEVIRATTEVKALRDFLLVKLEAAARARYGDELSLPLIIQVESAKQRLSKAAEVQAAQRAEGWVIERVEWKFEFAIGAATISGKIDRIDRHEQTGQVRVIDYKTSDKPVNPATAHLRKVRRSEDPTTLPAWALVEDGDAPRVWTDLQLPLYLRAVAAEFGDAVASGYFNLPKASTETGVALWEGYDRALQASAEACAAGIVAAVAARAYWPPAEVKGREDDYAPLFHHGAAESVRWTPAGDEVGDAAVGEERS